MLTVSRRVILSFFSSAAAGAGAVSSLSIDKLNALFFLPCMVTGETDVAKLHTGALLRFHGSIRFPVAPPFRKRPGHRILLFLALVLLLFLNVICF